MKFFEKYYPFIAALTIILLAACFKRFLTDSKGLVDRVAENALTISVTLLGFFLTILTIINSVDTRRMRFVKNDGLYPRVLGFLTSAIKANVILIGLSFVVKYFNYRQFDFLRIRGINILDFGYLFVFVFTLLLSFRFTDIFVRLLADPKVE